MASAVALIAPIVASTVQRVVRRLQARPRAGGPTDSQLKVEGMTCQHCVGNVKRALEAVKGVEEATPDLAAGQVTIRGEELEPRALAEVVEKAGYKAVPLGG